MSSDNKVPAIRFKGFSKSWSEEKIQELIDRLAIIDHLDGNHGELYPSANEFSNAGIPYISANDFVTGFMNFSGCKYLPRQRALKFKKGIAKDGDILFAHNATVGPVAKLTTSYDFVILSTTATYFRCDNKILVNDYLLQALSNKKFVEQYSRVMVQSTRNQVPITAQRKFSIAIPENTYEQIAIGNYFQKLDSLINQHQQKHDKLTHIKKTMLEKMFPKQGETIPEIRFKGFNGEWEYNVLQNICDVRDGTHSSPQYHQNGFPLVTSKNVKNGYINYDDTQCISKIDFDEINKRSRVDINDILMGMIGTIGNIALVREAPDFAIKNVALIKDKNIANFLYIYYSLQSQTITHQLDDSSSGGTQKFVSLSNIRELLTPLPKRKEQTAIGNYFQKLDTLINQHQQQITKLNNIKQACLSKMFV